MYKRQLQETLRQTKELLDLQDTDCGQLKEELLTLSRQEEELSAGIQGCLLYTSRCV